MKGNMEMVIFSIVCFIGFLGLMTSLIGQDIYNSQVKDNPYLEDRYNVTIEGLNYENFRAPTCTFDWNPLNDLYCLGAYLGFFTTLMTINTDYVWLAALLFIPIIAVIGYVIVRLIRGGG